MPKPEPRSAKRSLATQSDKLHPTIACKPGFAMQKLRTRTPARPATVEIGTIPCYQAQQEHSTIVPVVLGTASASMDLHLSPQKFGRYVARSFPLRTASGTIEMNRCEASTFASAFDAPNC
eukprot:2964347-Heterocapsa_arctica.AAC.1